MLHPQNNSLEYSTGIAPPDGFELKYAMGTTYSLDLEALLMIPIAMIYASHIEKVNGDLTYETISALSDVSKKIDIFCQKGNIKSPKQNNPLYSFWEDSIHEVVLDNAHKSFHPKVWVLQFANKQNEQRYKLFVSSKNLTQSGNWDIAYCTEGKLTNEIQVTSQPIVDFITYLVGLCDIVLPKDFISNLAKVEFEKPDNWNSQKFHPIGIPNYENTLAKKKFDELLVISPFIDATSVKLFSKNSDSNLTLCSTQHALNEIDAQILNKANYQFNKTIETIGDNEEMFDGVDEHLLSQSLHAKIFIGKKGETISWNFGSANATSPALEARNIEFNVELACKLDYCSPKQILKQLIPNKRKDDTDIKLFELFIPSTKVISEEDKKKQTQLRNLVFELNNLTVYGKLEKTDNLIDYHLSIELKTIGIEIAPFTIKLKPLSCYHEKAKTLKPSNYEILEFKNISLHNISQFVIWEIYHNGKVQKEFMTKMIIDIPIEERRGKILKTLFDTREKLFKYISFLITNDENEAININEKFKEEKNGSKTLDTNNLNGLPIYEKLLIASSRMPQKLNAISKLLENLSSTNDDGTDIISEEFKVFWAEFEKFKAIHNEQSN